MLGVAAGAALGVLAAKKSGPLVESAMLKYVASRAKGVTDQVDMLEYVASRAKEVTDQVDVPSTDQAAAAPRPDEPDSTVAGAASRYVTH